MFSTRQEIAEETEGILTTEHSDSMEASSRQPQQDDDVPCQRPKLSTEIEEEEQPEERTANGESIKPFRFPFPVAEVTVVCCST